MDGYIISTVATDALVLKHRAISIHSVDSTFILLGQFLSFQNIANIWQKNHILKKCPACLRLKP